MNDKTSFIDQPVKPFTTVMLEELEKLGELPPQGLTPEKLGKPEFKTDMSYGIAGTQFKLMRMERVISVMTQILHTIKGIEKHAKDGDCYPWTADTLSVTVFGKQLRTVVHSVATGPKCVQKTTRCYDDTVESPEQIQKVLDEILLECLRKEVIVKNIDTAAIFVLVDRLTKTPSTSPLWETQPVMEELQGDANED